MAIFNGYVKLPEGTSHVSSTKCSEYPPVISWLCELFTRFQLETQCVWVSCLFVTPKCWSQVLPRMFMICMCIYIYIYIWYTWLFYVSFPNLILGDLYLHDMFLYLLLNIYWLDVQIEDIFIWWFPNMVVPPNHPCYFPVLPYHTTSILGVPRFLGNHHISPIKISDSITTG